MLVRLNIFSALRLNISRSPHQPQGTGSVTVEMSARVVAEMNTKNRLGKVDGRYPHWVSNYDVENEERFSLIYYDTLSAYQTPGPAIFSIPKDEEV